MDSSSGGEWTIDVIEAFGPGVFKLEKLVADERTSVVA